MSYTRPTQQQIFDVIKADLFSRFPQLDPTLSNSMSIAIVSVMSAANSGNYDYLDWIIKQVFPDTATVERLDKWGAIFGLSRDAAAKSTGSVTATATVGSSVPIGSELQTIGGTRFVLTQALDFTVSSPQTATVEAVEFGPDGNVATSTQLDFVQAWPGVASFATVDAPGLAGGRDRQTDDSFLAEVLARLAEPPKGGAIHDYDRWIKEAVAATRTFVRNHDNAALYGDPIALGVITVWFAMDDTYADGIPTGGEEVTVQSYLDVVKPAGAQVTANAPTAFPVAFNVSITPDNATTQAATEEELKNGIIEGGQVGGTIPLNKFQESMAAVPGLTSWTINSPVAGVAAGVGQLHTLGTVTFT